MKIYYITDDAISVKIKRASLKVIIKTFGIKYILSGLRKKTIAFSPYKLLPTMRFLLKQLKEFDEQCKMIYGQMSKRQLEDLFYNLFYDGRRN